MLITSGQIFLNLDDAVAISQASLRFEKSIPTCCKQILKMKFSLQIMHSVTFNNSKTKNNNFRKTEK